MTKTDKIPEEFELQMVIFKDLLPCWPTNQFECLKLKFEKSKVIFIDYIEHFVFEKTWVFEHPSEVRLYFKLNCVHT